MIKTYLTNWLKIVTIPESTEKLYFLYFFGLPKFNKDVQKSIIEPQDIATFFITDFFLSFW